MRKWNLILAVILIKYGIFNLTNYRARKQIIPLSMSSRAFVRWNIVMIVASIVVLLNEILQAILRGMPR